MFRKVLIANRGEIAVRIIRACRELGVGCVAVYSEIDREAVHAAAADEAFFIGPAPAAQSYLNVDKLLEIAKRAGCDAVHPGYGFLAENAAFARRCVAENLTFIGPSAAAIERMGDKVAARAAAQAAKVPVVPGTIAPVSSATEARAAARKFGYPIAVKAAAGGGGKGLKVARDEREVDQAVSLAQKEAAAYFKDPTIYVERYLLRPKHVEVQVLADRRGSVVHLGERDCSLQRRHQKLVEETPACIDDKLRRRLIAAAVKLALFIGYDSAGTVECLVEDGEFFFLEMNTRIQVEHTITEAAWGIDLVKAQMRIAAGEPLRLSQDDLHPHGHAIEARINAESPAKDFRPSPGRIVRYAEPGGPGVRIDAAARAGQMIPQEYDSLIAKLVAWGENREEARCRMLRALDEFAIEGIETTIPLLRLLFAGEEFKRGDYATPTVQRFIESHATALQAAYPAGTAASGDEATAPQTVTVEVNEKRFAVRVFGLAGAVGGNSAPAAPRTPKFKPPKRIGARGISIDAPMHGVVAEMKVAAGDSVSDGQVVAIIEAMKMMNEVVAHRPGIVRAVEAQVGETVEMGAPLLTFADDR